MKPLIFAACDQGYYDLYGKILKASSAAHGMECLVHCSGLTADSEESKADHNVLRYKMLPDILSVRPSVLVLDVDSIINEAIEIPDRYDLGLFLRPAPDIRKKVLGSVFYITDRAKDFADELKGKLAHQTHWYEDQMILWRLYQKNFDRYKVMQFGLDFINWHCRPAPIWTGKGDVKLKNQIYRKLAAKYA
jgi:hypothetical protein